MKPLELLDLDAVKAVMAERLSDYTFDTEILNLQDALGRKLAVTKSAGFAVPGFRRSAVDGFAVKMDDFTHGACELTLVGRVEMGKPFDCPLTDGETVYVPTGGMVPEGTEAMVMQEYAHMEGGLSGGLNRLTENDETPPPRVGLKYEPKSGEHVVSADEDFKEGQVLVVAGTHLKPAHLGKLAAAGYGAVEVFCRPKVVILSTGNELLMPSALSVKPEMGQVYDINRSTLVALAENMGFQVVSSGSCGDDETTLYEALNSSLEVADLVILSGGSSVGEKDVTARAVNRFESSEILFHGIRIKPGKPTLLAQIGPRKKVILGLPGHPASAYMIMACFGGHLAENVWRSVPSKRPYSAIFAEDLKAAEDRDQMILVKLVEEPAGKLMAYPLLGKSAVISRISESDGYILQRVRDGALHKGMEVWVNEI